MGPDVAQGAGRVLVHILVWGSQMQVVVDASTAGDVTGIHLTKKGKGMPEVKMGAIRKPLTSVTSVTSVTLVVSMTWAATGTGMVGHTME